MRRAALGCTLLAVLSQPAWAEDHVTFESGTSVPTCTISWDAGEHLLAEFASSGDCDDALAGAAVIAAVDFSDVFAD